MLDMKKEKEPWFVTSDESLQKKFILTKKIQIICFLIHC